MKKILFVTLALLILFGVVYQFAKAQEPLYNGIVLTRFDLPDGGYVWVQVYVHPSAGTFLIRTHQVGSDGYTYYANAYALPYQPMPDNWSITVCGSDVRAELHWGGNQKAIDMPLDIDSGICETQNRHAVWMPMIGK